MSVGFFQVLERGAPYPQVILPVFGGYWIEEPPPPAPPPQDKEGGDAEKEEEEEEEEGRLRGEVEENPLAGDYGYQLEEISEAARAYREHFLGRVRSKWVNGNATSPAKSKC